MVFAQLPQVPATSRDLRKPSTRTQDLSQKKRQSGFWAHVKGLQLETGTFTRSAYSSLKGSKRHKGARNCLNVDVTKSTKYPSGGHQFSKLEWLPTSTPQLPCKRPQIPSSRNHKALDGGTLGGCWNVTSHFKRFSFGPFFWAPVGFWWGLFYGQPFCTWYVELQ